MNNILLLHGALGAKSQFDELEKSLNKDFVIHKINFSGHGGKAIPDSPFSIKLFAGDVIKYLDANGIEKTDMFGYSMGGYVGVYIARHLPDRSGKVLTLGTKFLWNRQVAHSEVKMLDAQKMKEKIPQFYETLAERHSPQSVEIILEKTAEMMLNLGDKNELGEEDYQKIENEITIGVGDRDKMVSIEESEEVFRRLPKGRLLVLPATPHPFEQVNIERLDWEIRNFFNP